MNMPRIGLYILLIVTCSAGFAETQMQLNKKACNELRQADKSLNQVYQQILAAHNDDSVFIKHFKEAQRKWVAFRDAYVESMYIPEYSGSYGSIMPMCQCYFIEDITNQRIKQLRVWVDGVEEGDSCAGSTQ